MSDSSSLKQFMRGIGSNVKRSLAGLILKKTSLREQLSEGPYEINNHEDRISINVSNVPPGLYFIRIVHESDESLLGAHLMTKGINDEESSRDIFIFVTKDQQEFYGTVKITNDIDSLIFYPSRLPVTVNITECYLRAINAFGRKFIYGQTYVRIRSFGLDWTIDRIKEETRDRLERLVKGGTDDSYPTWWRLYGRPSETTLSRQREWSRDQEAENPGISIIMPVYNTRIDLLNLAVNSVIAQSYPHWELCIADDASTDPALADYLNTLTKLDTRIKVVFRMENGHISAASNSALNLAQANFVGFMDHDDELSPNALYEVMRGVSENPAVQMIYSDEDIISDGGEPLYPHFKPDWNLDLARSINYICHFMVLPRDRVIQLGGFREGGYEGAQDLDLMLRVTEGINRDQILHIPRILYHWRATAGSTVLDHSAKNYSTDAGIKALRDHIQRLGLPAHVQPSEIPTAYRFSYQLPELQPSVTLIVPTYNNIRVLKNCIESIQLLTEYDNYEILVIDNRTDDPVALSYLQNCQCSQVRVIKYPGEFNFSAINNFAVNQTQSEVIVLLNNDTEVCNSGWLQEMVSHAIRPEVGAVGAKLFYAQDLIQHAGVLLGMGPDKVAGHAFKGAHKHETGPMARTRLIQAYSAVTAACMAVSRKKYLEAGGLDEEHLAIAFNDVDFCLKLQEHGYTNIWTPYAQLYHYESYSRGYDHGDDKKRERFLKERDYMHKRWGTMLLSDPFYNPNMSTHFDNFSLAWPPCHDERQRV